MTDDLKEFVGGETRDYDIGQWSTAGMRLGRNYKIWCENSGFVVIMDDLGQWRMFPEGWFAGVPLLTDLGAAEYEDIMSSIGEA